MNQISYSFDKASVIKIIKGAAIAGGAVAALYILEALAKVNFGQYSVLAAAILSVLINTVKEYIKGRPAEEE